MRIISIITKSSLKIELNGGSMSRKINIPTIYEEDIEGFCYRGDNICIKYNYEGATINLNFSGVYMFDFFEFDYLNDTEWEFGLCEYKESSLLTQIKSGINPQWMQYAFGGEMDKVRHYKLVIDDVGMYNIVCKNFSLIQE